MTSTSGLVVDIPGAAPLALRYLLLDFNGTVAVDGQWIDGVQPRLERLARVLHIELLTGDTYGTLGSALAGLPLQARVIASGADKAARAAELATRGVVAIGNGANDAAMLRTATLGIAVLGPEGLHVQTLQSARVIAPSIAAALDLLLHPQRLRATLRP